jgi:cytoplasmic iron level regulating protein YaaA (DUF328/UPF0246 family)
MLILLPPSETKRSGGSRRPLDLDALAFSALRPQREAVIAALEALSADEDRAARVLGLSPRQRGDIAANAALSEGPTLPAVDRYTGVLYDALDAGTLDAAARRWLGTHVRIHSAPLGPVGSLDRIPLYRLGASAALPGIPPLRRVWADAVGAALTQSGPRFVLDLRSEAYVALGPVPPGISSAYVRVVTAGEGGATRALNHFNKHAKGALVRALCVERPRIHSVSGLLRWADAAGWRFAAGPEGELQLGV